MVWESLTITVFFLKDVVLETYVEYSNKRSLKQPHQHVAPVVLVIRDSGVAHIHREGHQEELDGGPEKSGPLCCESRLHVKLWWEMEWKTWKSIKKEEGCQNGKKDNGVGFWFVLYLH